VARPCCRLGPPGPRSPISPLVVLQQRQLRGRLTTPSPPALATFPRAAFFTTVAPADFVCTRDGRARRCPGRRRPPRWNRARCWRLAPPRPPLRPQVWAPSLHRKR
jgi:hypothetical protein